MKRDLAANKIQIRSQILQQRQLLQDDDSLRASRSLISLFERAHWRPPHLLLYAAMKAEFPTREFFEWALKTWAPKIYFPRVLETESLNFHRVESWNQLAAAKFCLEPSANAEAWLPDLAPQTIALIPGLAFSTGGDRLGFGKGHYDRFLEKLNTLPTIGLAYEFQIHPAGEWDVFSWDRPVKSILSDRGALWGQTD